MGAFFIYILKSGFCLVVFYLFFRFLMSRTTFFCFNRITILVGMLVCLLLPLVEISIPERMTIPTPWEGMQEWDVQDERYMEPQASDVQFSQTVNAPPAMNRFGLFIRILTIFYLLGGVGVLLYLTMSTFRMLQLIAHSRKIPCCGYSLVIVSQPIGSFSWGKYIVLSEQDYYNHADEIILHEQMHVRFHHTFDLVVTQLFLVIHWINPAVWLLKRELQEIHEYEADNGVIQSGIDATRYQLLLVKKAVGTRLYSMANGFNHSKLKNRISMMLKEETVSSVRWRLLFLVPVLMGVMYTFAQVKVEEPLIIEEVQEEKPQGLFSLMQEFKDELLAYRAIIGDETQGTLSNPWPNDGTLYINLKNAMMFQQERVTMDALKTELVRAARAKQQNSSGKAAETKPYCLLIMCDRGADAIVVEHILTVCKEAAEELKRTSQSDTKGSVHPLVVNFAGIMKSAKHIKEAPYQKLEGVEITVYQQGKKIVWKDLTVAELEAKLADWSKEHKEGEESIVGLKITSQAKMAEISEIKDILRKLAVKKINYSMSETRL